jgi:SHS2 domain-containing protein
MEGQAGRTTAVAPSHFFLEHTGEVRLRLRAGSLAELFAEAGRALAELLLRGASAAPAGAAQEIEVRSADRAALLVDWLNELIYWAESEAAVPTEFDMREVGDSAIRARVRSAPVEQPPALVKAATLHGARVEPVAGGWEGDVILDV